MTWAVFTAEIEQFMRDGGVVVLTKTTDAPPVNRGWAIVYGANPWDDTEERPVSGDCILEHGEVTVMCAGHNRAEAQFVLDRALLLRGRSIAGSGALFRQPSRGLTPEDDSDANPTWSAPVVLRITR